jgi:hypothetical protein
MTKLRPLCFPGTILFLLLAILATGTPAAAATNGQTTSPGVASSWGYADFDGDSKPDLVEHRSTFLDVQLSTGRELRLGSELDANTLGTEIVVVDLDGDHDLDIVVRNRFLNQHSDIWLNDGQGFFSKSATRDYSFPFENRFWSQSPTLDPGIAAATRNSKSLAIDSDIWFLPPTSAGRTLQTIRGDHPSQVHTDTIHLRGPPISSLR